MRKHFQLIAEEEFLRKLKIEAAKKGESMTAYVIAAVKERIERTPKK